MNRRRVDFQPKRLTQARSAKMLNMRELAEKTGLTRQSISQYEKGTISPSPETLRVLASELGVNEKFFTRPILTFEAHRENPPSFRSLESSTAKARRQAQSYLEWMTLVADIFGEYISFPDVSIPDFEIGDFSKLSDSDIEDIANETRKHFGLKGGPISNMTLLLENHGIVIGQAPLQAQLDGLCAWFYGRPFILINSRANAVRHRFDLAHELGHLILHKKLTTGAELENKEIFNLVEKQAHYYAGAFLMPESTFSTEIYGVDIESLVRLKERWQVSIAAMIMRMTSTDLITENQKYRLFQALNARNIRRHEPLDDSIEREKPRLNMKILELLMQEKILVAGELLDETGLAVNLLAQLTAIPQKLLERQEIADNVIPLRR